MAPGELAPHFGVPLSIEVALDGLVHRAGRPEPLLGRMRGGVPDDLVELGADLPVRGRAGSGSRCAGSGSTR